jgi:ribosome-associated heat shock protein Hsp15|tara:strand:+ start:1597 stop:1959 length:363 start_codon:yes stop_codon:yes gene_type:complete
MRIDQLLWCLRYYKSRSLATSACKKGYIKINGENVKPSKEVIVLDKITLRKNQINHEFKILDIPKNRVGAKLLNIYRKNLTNNELNTKKFMTLDGILKRKKGEGRPTKKDRRKLDDLNKS